MTSPVRRADDTTNTAVKPNKMYRYRTARLDRIDPRASPRPAASRARPDASARDRTIIHARRTMPVTALRGPAPRTSRDSSLASRPRPTARASAARRRVDDDVDRARPIQRSLAALLAAACVAAVPFDADAALVNPNTRLPRSARAALRRAVPAINEETASAQKRLEEAAYLLRIPQRKPWAAMSEDVEETRRVLTEKRSDVFAPVRETDRARAEEAYAGLNDALTRLSRAAGTRDVDAFDAQIARALDRLSELQIAQAPGLPFQIPGKYMELPKLTGRATVEVTVRNRGGGGFGLLNGEKLDEATLEITVDGYNAPITGGNFVDNVKRGVYTDSPMRRSETAILGGSSDAAAESIPLEIKASDAFDPLYRAPLDVQSGEAIPTIPLSINGSVAMAKSNDGQSDKEQFFIYLFDKRSAGLGGLSFEEGEFSVFGYVTKGEEYLGSIGTDAVITSAKVTSGEDKLANARQVVVAVESDFAPSS